MAYRALAVGLSPLEGPPQGGLSVSRPLSAQPKRSIQVPPVGAETFR